MGLFDRWRRDEAPGRVIVPDRRVRSAQLLQLEAAILDVMDEMERSPHWRNPGWQAQVLEFYDVLAQIRALRPREYTWVELGDLAFLVRPVMRAQQVTEEFAALGRAQQRMMALATALTEPMPGEVQEAASGR